MPRAGERDQQAREGEREACRDDENMRADLDLDPAPHRRAADSEREERDHDEEAWAHGLEIGAERGWSEVASREIDGARERANGERGNPRG